MACRLEAYNESPEQQAIGKKLQNVNVFKSKGDIPIIEIDFAKRIQELQNVRHNVLSTAAANNQLYQLDSLKNI